MRGFAMLAIVTRVCGTGCRSVTHVKALLKKGSVIILLGTGGVGKTTVAAALGIAGARALLDTALITVDPARRLRDALGLGRLRGQPVRLTRRQLAAAGLDDDLRLSAMMLDVKGTWDSVMERIARDPAARRRILENPFYQRLTAEFAGSEAFAALQQLYELHESRGFELEVVDTPPAAHAFEFLEAPAQYARLFDSRAARWLFAPSLSAGRIAARIAGQAARFVVRELERYAGGSVLSTITEFFAAMAEGVDALVDRLRKTEALMHSPAVKFVMVTTAEEDRLRQARELMADMKADGLALAGIVINRFLDERTWQESMHTTAAHPALEHLSEIGIAARILTGDGERRPHLDALADYLGAYRELTLQEIGRVAAFARELPDGVKLALAPEIDIGVRDLAALSRVADYLTGASGILRTLESAAARLRERGGEVPRRRSAR
jgi:anion-transporting  ArsA/GET3 family ATPase